MKQRIIRLIKDYLYILVLIVMVLTFLVRVSIDMYKHDFKQVNDDVDQLLNRIPLADCQIDGTCGIDPQDVAMDQSEY